VDDFSKAVCGVGGVASISVKAKGVIVHVLMCNSDLILSQRMD
jgi:hypothetical protein